MLLVALVLCLAVLALITYLHFDDHVHAYQLLDDSTSWAGVKWYTGFLSHVVVLLWCASAALCGFATTALRGSDDAELRGLCRFLSVMAVVNIWLTLDDLFLFHEQTARLLVGRSSQHEIEGVIFGLYALSLAAIFWWHRTVIARMDYPLLGMAIVSLLASAAVDVAFQLEMDGANIFRETVLSVSWGPTVTDITEEVLKLNGAVLWLSFFFLGGFAGVRQLVAGSQTGQTLC